MFLPDLFPVINLFSLYKHVVRSVVLETDPTIISNRVAMRGAEREIPLAEQSLSQVWAGAREQMTRALLK